LATDGCALLDRGVVPDTFDPCVATLDRWVVSDEDRFLAGGIWEDVPQNDGIYLSVLVTRSYEPVDSGEAAGSAIHRSVARAVEQRKQLYSFSVAQGEAYATYGLLPTSQCRHV
jgi:hypothetical protein